MHLPTFFVLPSLLLIACAGKGGDDSPVTFDCPAGQPCISIVTPASGSTIPTCLSMTVAVENFTVVSPVEHQEEVDGEGHWNIVINSEPKNFPCEALDCSITLDGYADGELTVEADLVGNTGVAITDDDDAAILDSATYTLAADGVLCP